MKEEVPNKLPNQTIKKYEEDGNRIRVDFLKGESIYLQNTPETKQTLDTMMAKDIAAYDEQFKDKRNQSGFIKMISGGISAGALASTSYGVAIGGRNTSSSSWPRSCLSRWHRLCYLHIKKQVLQKVTLISKSKRCFSKRRKNETSTS